mgnify:CR=1 FL=1
MKKILFALLLSTLAITSIQPSGEPAEEEEEEFCCNDSERLDLERKRLEVEKLRLALEQEKYNSWKLFKMAQVCLELRNQRLRVSKTNSPKGFFSKGDNAFDLCNCIEVLDALNQTFYAKGAPKKPFTMASHTEK